MDRPHGEQERLDTIFAARVPAKLSLRPSYKIAALEFASGGSRWREEADNQFPAIELKPAFRIWCFGHHPSIAAGPVWREAGEPAIFLRMT